ncbi:histidine kinase N-terminal domain-containing protein [Bacillus sp. 03113]|uniref:histidine kinase N-terminal domain-containing protein n=1 Tax=Bacillus sp. 03113 TaxID=2578211 RepID=UPI00114407CA|nr:histidine kinase N-terminal domain-containing protein [Bacillus sp. 03113]
MVSLPNKKLFVLLEEKKEAILTEWEKKIILTNDEDILREQVKKNGEIILYVIIYDMPKNDQTILDLFIKAFSSTIAKERVNENMNIGNFVYNINAIRMTLNKHIYQFQQEWKDIQFITNQIDHFLDRLLYLTVTLYTEAKNRIIEEKTKFIDLSHKDRLTLLGQMTSSFIHEFRNPLTSIQGFIQLLKADHPSLKYWDIISNELEQLNYRISQFLLLSKKELIGKEKKFFSLNELIDEVLTFLYPSILDGNVEITKNYEAPITIFGYPDEIRQVLINIIFNAIDVLVQYRTNPMIEINISIINTENIKVEIANNGPMIPPHLIDSIFEPFVTTKKLGTGLGLFVCREIIEKHKGSLTCHSESDRTLFTISLPLLKNTTIFN